MAEHGDAGHHVAPFPGETGQPPALGSQHHQDGIVPQVDLEEDAPADLVEFEAERGEHRFKHAIAALQGEVGRPVHVVEVVVGDLVVERERERIAFVPAAYWDLSARFDPGSFEEMDRLVVHRCADFGMAGKRMNGMRL